MTATVEALTINGPRALWIGATVHAVARRSGIDEPADATWTSSNPDVADVFHADGMMRVRAVGAGTVTITATTADGATGSADYVVHPR